jgi:hypothetical protein
MDAIFELIQADGFIVASEEGLATLRQKVYLAIPEEAVRLSYVVADNIKLLQEYDGLVDPDDVWRQFCKEGKVRDLGDWAKVVQKTAEMTHESILQKEIEEFFEMVQEIMLQFPGYRSVTLYNVNPYIHFVHKSEIQFGTAKPDIWGHLYSYYVGGNKIDTVTFKPDGHTSSYTLVMRNN